MTHYQKAYLNQSARQILADAKVMLAESNEYEIMHPGFPGCILAADAEGDLIVRSFYGIELALICGPSAKAMLRALEEEREDSK